MLIRWRHCQAPKNQRKRRKNFSGNANLTPSRVGLNHRPSSKERRVLADRTGDIFSSHLTSPDLRTDSLLPPQCVLASTSQCGAPACRTLALITGFRLIQSREICSLIHFVSACSAASADSPGCSAFLLLLLLLPDWVPVLCPAR